MKTQLRYFLGLWAFLLSCTLGSAQTSSTFSAFNQYLLERDYVSAFSAARKILHEDDFCVTEEGHALSAHFLVAEALRALPLTKFKEFELQLPKSSNPKIEGLLRDGFTDRGRKELRMMALRFLDRGETEKSQCLFDKLLDSDEAVEEDKQYRRDLLYASLAAQLAGDVPRANKLRDLAFAHSHEIQLGNKSISKEEWSVEQMKRIPNEAMKREPKPIPAEVKSKFFCGEKDLKMNPLPTKHAIGWVGPDGHSYLFGGYRTETAISSIISDHLWRSGDSLSEWVQLSGFGTTKKDVNQKGVRLTPTGRTSSSHQADKDGTVYLFGGMGKTEDSYVDSINELWKYDSNSGQWTLLSGSKSGGGLGVYHEKGVPDERSLPSGRQGASSWKGKDGKLYFFGGYMDGEGYLNDLWSFDPKTKMWVWLSGSKPPVKKDLAQNRINAPWEPIFRAYSSQWVDAKGNLYLYGGAGIGELGANYVTYYNDLWRYDPKVSRWTCISGDKNKGRNIIAIEKLPQRGFPEARYGASYWVGEDGTFYLSGGGIRAGEYYTDTWSFDPETGKWKELSEKKTEKTAAGVKFPSGRLGASHWVDKDGSFILFGGEGLVDGELKYYNDFWRFDPKTSKWKKLSDQSTYVSFTPTPPKSPSNAEKQRRAENHMRYRACFLQAFHQELVPSKETDDPRPSDIHR